MPAPVRPQPRLPIKPYRLEWFRDGGWRLEFRFRIQKRVKHPTFIICVTDTILLM